MKAFKNNQNISFNQYADNLESAVEEFIRLSKLIPEYQKQVGSFYKRAVTSFTKNKVKLQQLGLGKFEREARLKANRKIRKMINISEAEFDKIKTQRIDKLAFDIAEKFKVNLFTLKKVLK